MNSEGFEYLTSGPVDGRAVTSLVLLLHGYGRNASYMQKMADAVRAVVPGALVLSLHGPEIMNNAVMDNDGDNHLHIPGEVIVGDDGNQPQMMRQWFRIDGQREALIPRLDAVAGRLNAFIDTQRDHLSLSDSDIVLMGFSQGGGTALYTAYTRKTEIAALVSHSSIVIDKPGGNVALASKPKTLFLYGAEDPEFPQAVYERSFQWVQDYTGGGGTEIVVPELGHYTNSTSRKLCADYIQNALT
jgi:phospholipase/carboxylesterase